MKCDFCSFNEMPASLPAMARHIDSDHIGLTDSVVVWRGRDIQLVSKNSLRETDTVLEFYAPGIVSQLPSNGDDSGAQPLAEEIYQEESDLDEVDVPQSEEAVGEEEEELVVSELD